MKATAEHDEQPDGRRPRCATGRNQRLRGDARLRRGDRRPGRLPVTSTGTAVLPAAGRSATALVARWSGRPPCADHDVADLPARLGGHHDVDDDLVGLRLRGGLRRPRRAASACVGATTVPPPAVGERRELRDLVGVGRERRPRRRRPRPRRCSPPSRCGWRRCRRRHRRRAASMVAHARPCRAPALAATTPSYSAVLAVGRLRRRGRRGPRGGRSSAATRSVGVVGEGEQADQHVGGDRRRGRRRRRPWRRRCAGRRRPICSIESLTSSTSIVRADGAADAARSAWPVDGDRLAVDASTLTVAGSMRRAGGEADAR